MSFEDLINDLSRADNFDDVAAVFTSAGAAIAGFIIMLYFALFLWIILHLVAWCKLFTKAGLPWERMFVPLYGSYWQYKVADSAGIFWINLFAPAIITVVMLISGVGIFTATSRRAVESYTTTYTYINGQRVSRRVPVRNSSSIESDAIGGLSLLGIIMIILLAALFVLFCIYMTRLARNYGKSGGFAVGLILLYPIFILVLGLGSSEYVGSQGNFNRIREDSMKRSWTCSVCNTVNPASRSTCETCGSTRS